MLRALRARRRFTPTCETFTRPTSEDSVSLSAQREALLHSATFRHWVAVVGRSRWLLLLASVVAACALQPPPSSALATAAPSASSSQDAVLAVRAEIPLDGLLALAPSRDGVWYLRALGGQAWIGEASVERSMQEERAGPQPVALAATSSAIYVLEGRPETNPNQPRVDVVERLDPATLKVTASVSVGALATDLAADGSTVWVVTVDGALLGFDTQTLSPTARVQLQGDGPSRLGVGAGRVWVVNGSVDEAGKTAIQIHGIDTRSGQETVSLTVPGDAVTAVLTVGEKVWVATGTGAAGLGRAFPIDTDGSVGDQFTVPTPVAISQEGDRLWWASLDGRVGAFAPDGTSAAAPLQVGSGAADLVLSSSLVWVASDDLIVLHSGP